MSHNARKNDILAELAHRERVLRYERRAGGFVAFCSYREITEWAPGIEQRACIYSPLGFSGHKWIAIEFHTP